MMTTKEGHKWYCFAKEPAPPGYFPDDVLPCVCDAPGSVLPELDQLFVMLPVMEDHRPVLLPAA